ncbi:Hypothetical predicted protein, partial [Paramuricea clavata]
MASKTAKVDFSAEAILRKIQERKELLNHINTLKGQLVLEQVTDSLRSLKKHVNFDVVGLLAFMFGFDAIMWIMLAIRHVPKTFARYKNSRCNIIFTIIDHLCPCRFSVTLVDDIVCFLEEFAPESPFLGNYSAVFEEALCTLSKREKLNFGGFIVPPVEDCLRCGSILSAPNPRSSCTLYTITGPKQCAKLVLRCKDCKVSYGRSMIAEGKGNASYYFEAIAAADDLIEVTNVVYMEKRLYRWLPSLTDGFSVSYNELFSREIRENFESDVTGDQNDDKHQNFVPSFSD